MVRHRLDSISAFARQGHNLRIVCDACGHRVEAASRVMLIELGPSRAKMPIERLEEKLKCSACDHRGASVQPCEPTL